MFLNLKLKTMKNKNCDMCGEPFTGKAHKVYDENFNIQSGLIQCSHCAGLNFEEIKDMKNIHIIKTDKTLKTKGDLVKDKYGDIHIFTKNDGKEYGKTTTKLNIYITNSEEIKPNVYCLINGVLCKTELLEGKIVSRQLNGGCTMDICKTEYSEIILTTDQSLDGVQPIDDIFLEWFVKNQSCDEVEVKPLLSNNGRALFGYKIIIPKEELKQESLEEAAERAISSGLFKDKTLFIAGAKWMQERMFSEGEVTEIAKNAYNEGLSSVGFSKVQFGNWFTKWFEQFKKK